MMLSFIIFTILLVSIVSFWFNGVHSSGTMLARNRMETELIGASEILVKSPGFPEDWETNSSNVTVLGLASEPNMLNAAKLSNFTNLSYSHLRELLGLSHEFSFAVQDQTGNLLYAVGNSSAGTSSSVTMTRFAVLDGQVVKVVVTAHD